MWQISFVNINMLLATIPSYEGKEEKENEKVIKGKNMADTMAKIFKDE